MEQGKAEVSRAPLDSAEKLGIWLSNMSVYSNFFVLANTGVPDVNITLGDLRIIMDRLKDAIEEKAKAKGTLLMIYRLSQSAVL